MPRQSRTRQPTLRREVSFLDLPHTHAAATPNVGRAQPRSDKTCHSTRPKPQKGPNNADGTERRPEKHRPRRRQTPHSTGQAAAAHSRTDDVWMWLQSARRDGAAPQFKSAFAPQRQTLVRRAAVHRKFARFMGPSEMERAKQFAERCRVHRVNAKAPA